MSSVLKSHLYYTGKRQLSTPKPTSVGMNGAGSVLVFLGGGGCLCVEWPGSDGEVKRRKQEFENKARAHERCTE